MIRSSQHLSGHLTCSIFHKISKERKGRNKNRENYCMFPLLSSFSSSVATPWRSHRSYWPFCCCLVCTIISSNQKREVLSGSLKAGHVAFGNMQEEGGILIFLWLHLASGSATLCSANRATYLYLIPGSESKPGLGKWVFGEPWLSNLVTQYCFELGYLGFRHLDNWLAPFWLTPSVISLYLVPSLL